MLCCSLVLQFSAMARRCGKNFFEACFIYLIFFIFSISLMPNSFASDTLKPGQSIRTSETLISPGQIFVLEFFYFDNHNQRYLGLRYMHDTGENFWILWVANRNNPASGATGVLGFTKDGNLTISDSGGSLTTLYSGDAASNSTLKLLDSGNLVLREGDSDNQGRILWQSFDHPTDTMLPGMKLGVNLKTRQSWALTSWITETVPALGVFTLGIDPNGTNQLFIWQRSELYWTSGIWNGSSFPNSPDMKWSDIYNIRFISNDDEHYFTFSPKDPAIMSLLVVSIMGKFQLWTWSESKHGWDMSYFLMTNPCEGGNKSQECVGLKPPSNCSNGEKFSSRRHAPLAPPKVMSDLSLRISDCEATCRTNCSCTAYATAYSNGTGCSFWYGEFHGFESSGEKDIFFRSEDDTSKNHHDPFGERIKRWIKLIIPLAIALTMIAAICMCYLRRKRKQRGKPPISEQQLMFDLNNNNRETFIELNNANSHSRDGREGPELPIFSLRIVSAATDNFSIANKLGQGGFGSVYKGKLLEGQEIAVKRLSKTSKQGLEEFKNELILIVKVQHLNLVRIIGCCVEDEERILIYEYMPNKSLDCFLFDHVKGAQLDWGTRARIVEGIAQGLLYLHRYSRLKIIHRDLKASNILLDNEMNPKISDFGLARIFEQNISEANTRKPAGTYGYMAPEYAFQGLFSAKSDVFSFGVLLLEIVSGKKCTGIYHFSNSMNLLGYAWELWKDDRGSELIDPLLGTSYPKCEVLRYINVALLCVQDSATDRPTMSNIILMLSNEGIALPSPKEPAFSTSIAANNGTSSVGETIPCSINDLTISNLDGR